MPPKITLLRPRLSHLLVALILLLIFLGVPYLLRPVATPLLVLFSGILLAVFLDALISLVRLKIPLPRWLALLLVLVLLLGILAGCVYLAGPRIAEQATALTDLLPQAVDTLQEKVLHKEWFQRLLPGNSGDSSSIPFSGILETVSGFFMGFFALLANALIILFLGIFLAFNPRVYTGALIRLLPLDKRSRGEEVIAKLGQVLRWWLVGQLAAMTVVGVLTAVGLLILGEPLALVLGLIAGLLSFIPFLGPVFSVVPALLVAVSRGASMVLWVLLVYWIVQLIESNLVTPLIQRKAVMLPPAFLIAAQFLFAILLGFFGVLLATPLTVLFTVLVQMLYIEDVLGDEVRILGEH